MKPGMKHSGLIKLENESVIVKPLWIKMAISVTLPLSADWPVVSISIIAYKSELLSSKYKYRILRKYFSG
jgi:hypothetical protein